MTENQQGSLKNLLPLLMQAGIVIAGLLIIWMIVTALPMLENIDFPLRFSLTDLIGAIMLTAIIVQLVSFASQIEANLKYNIRQLPQAGIISKLVIYLIVTLIAYKAYLPLVDPYLIEKEWIYSLVFLTVFIAFLIILGYNIYNNIESISTFITKNKDMVLSDNDLSCTYCGKSNPSNSKFCSECGSELPKKENRTCYNCGTYLKPGAKFCPGCGSKVEKSKEQEIS